MMDTGIDDATLIQRLSRSDSAAFDLLFLRHRRGVYRFIFRMVNHDTGLAEDLTQETFLRLWRARQTYQPGAATLRTYLLTVARRLVLDYRKRPQLPTAALPTDESPLSPELCGRLANGPEREILAQEFSGVLEAALASLSDDLREVTLLRQIEGLAYEEIADIVACPVGTVKSRLNAARARLRAAAQAYLEEKSA